MIEEEYQHTAADDSRPVWYISAVVISELKESVDQQLFNSVHSMMTGVGTFPGMPMNLDTPGHVDHVELIQGRRYNEALLPGKLAIISKGAVGVTAEQRHPRRL